VAKTFYRELGSQADPARKIFSFGKLQYKAVQFRCVVRQADSYNRANNVIDVLSHQPEFPAREKLEKRVANVSYAVGGRALPKKTRRFSRQNKPKKKKAGLASGLL
jgi:hypothetical protein